MFINKSDVNLTQGNPNDMTAILQKKNSLTCEVGNVVPGDVVYVIHYSPNQYPARIDAFDPVFEFYATKNGNAEYYTQSELISYLVATEGSTVTQASSQIDFQIYSGRFSSGIKNEFNAFNKTEDKQDSTEVNAFYATNDGDRWFKAKIASANLFATYGYDIIYSFKAKQDGIKVKLGHDAIEKWNWGADYSNIKVAIKKSGESAPTQLSDKITITGSVPKNYYFADINDYITLNTDDELYVVYYVTSIGNYASLNFSLNIAIGADLTKYADSAEFSSADYLIDSTNAFADVALLQGAYPSALNQNQDAFTQNGLNLKANSSSVVRYTMLKNAMILLKDTEANVKVYLNGVEQSLGAIHAKADDVVDFCFNSNEAKTIDAPVFVFDADAYDFTKRESATTEKIDAAEMYSRIYTPIASGNETVLVRFELLNGKVNDPTVTKAYDSDLEFNKLVGQHAFAFMALTTELGDFSLRMGAHIDYDAIIKITAKQNIVVNITHPAAGYDVWAFDTRGVL